MELPPQQLICMPNLAWDLDGLCKLLHTCFKAQGSLQFLHSMIFADDQ